MMKKKGYHIRKRRDHSKNKEYVRIFYKCKSPDHVVAECPYNSDNDEHEKKKYKSEKKDKKEKKMIFKKKKMAHMLSLGIVMLLRMMILVMMSRHLRRRSHLLALLSTTRPHSTSTIGDGLTCDASLKVENKTLKREVDEITHALGKAYGGEVRLLKCLGSQRFSLNKEGLG